MITMIDSVLVKSQIYLTRLSNWKNQSDLHIQCGPYLLKIAKNQNEVLQCFKLRYEVFYKELAGKTKASKLDYDQFDALCDHLIIVHEPTQKIVGTYRINSSLTSKKFYTETEFQIKNWLELNDSRFIELGRACIHSDHRRGAVISLLWRGIAEYMKNTSSTVLLGCSSVKVTDSRTAALLLKYFEVNQNLNSELFQPHKKYQIQDLLFWLMVFSKGLSQQQYAEAEEIIPSLLKAYIKAGAKICSYPALDKDFNCIDFMTILNRSELDQKLVRKYNA